MKLPRLMFLAMLPAMTLITAPGCAVRWTYKDGSETYAGFVWHRQMPAGKAGEPAVMIHTRRVGLGVDGGSQGYGFCLGYENLLRVMPPPDREIRVDYTDAPFSGAERCTFSIFGSGATKEKQ